MSDDQANGRATIREVRDLIQALDDKMDDRFSTLSHELEERYVLRAACRERSHVPMSEFIRETDKRYASKTAEHIIYSIVGIAGLAVLYKLLELASL